MKDLDIFEIEKISILIFLKFNIVSSSPKSVLKNIYKGKNNYFVHIIYNFFIFI